MLSGDPCRAAGPELGQKRQCEQDNGAGKRGNADPEMKDETDADIERHPWQVEQRGRSGTADKGADLVQIAQGLQSVAGKLGAQRQAHQRE